MPEQPYDLVIVGGGIGGSGLATVMARAGRSCLVLEKTLEFPDRTKGEWVAPWGVADAQAVSLYDDLVKARGHVITRHVGYDETIEPAEAEEGVFPLGALPGIAGPLTQRHPDACQALFDAAVEAGVDTKRGVDQVEVDLSSQPTVRYRHGGTDHVARACLVVGADGRHSVVRRHAGIPLHLDAPHHLFSGLLVDGADGWPDDLQAAGTEDDVHYLVFPQGGGRVRLYLGFALEQRHRLTGPDGPVAFLGAFRLRCLPEALADALVGATPVSPCATYPNEDSWTDTPAVDGVVLIGDAAGWNDPIIGQGLSITLRDVRMVSEVLRVGDDWSAAAFTGYADERTERMRRLRFSAALTSVLRNEFGTEARGRRAMAQARIADDPMLIMPLVAPIVGPDMAPEESFTRATWNRLLA